MRYQVTTVNSPLLVRNNHKPNAGVVAYLPSGSIIEVPANSIVKEGFRLIKRQGNWSHWAAERFMKAYHGPLEARNPTRQLPSTGVASTTTTENDNALAETGLSEIVSRILKDPVIARINFRYGALPVYGTGFARVAQAIDEGRITVREESLPRSGAEYDFDENILAIKRGANLNQLLTRGFVVHEATHALQDYQRTRMSVSDSEGAAFVAQYFYYILKAPRLLEVPETNDSAGVALSIARRIYTTSGGYLVLADEVARMRSKLPGAGYSHGELNAVRVTDGF